MPTGIPNDKPLNVFFCAQAIPRSILAEAILRHYGAGRYRAFSAGSMPAGLPNPAAIATPNRAGWITALRGRRAGMNSPEPPRRNASRDHRMRKRRRRGLPGLARHPHSAHWVVEDPAAVTGSRQQILNAFAVTYDQMKARVDALLALDEAPLADLMPRIRAIGICHDECRARPQLVAEFAGTMILHGDGDRIGDHGRAACRQQSRHRASGNTIPTGAILYVLITVFGPVSGAHFNPAVTMAFLLRREMSFPHAAHFMFVQVGGAICEAMLAHFMFEMPLLQLSQNVRTGPAQWTSGVATFGLLTVIFGGLRWRPERFRRLSGCISPPPTGSPPRQACQSGSDHRALLHRQLFRHPAGRCAVLYPGADDRGCGGGGFWDGCSRGTRMGRVTLTDDKPPRLDSSISTTEDP